MRRKHQNDTTKTILALLVTAVVITVFSITPVLKQFQGELLAALTPLDEIGLQQMRTALEAESAKSSEQLLNSDLESMQSRLEEIQKERAVLSTSNKKLTTRLLPVVWSQSNSTFRVYIEDLEIKIGTPVIWQNRIVGYVDGVYEPFATVKLLQNESEKLPVITSGGSRGELQIEGQMARVREVGVTEEVKVGDLVYWENTDYVVTQLVPIGKVTEIVSNDANSTMELVLEAHVNDIDLSYVRILDEDLLK